VKKQTFLFFFFFFLSFENFSYLRSFLNRENSQISFSFSFSFTFSFSSFFDSGKIHSQERESVVKKAFSLSLNLMQTHLDFETG